MTKIESKWMTEKAQGKKVNIIHFGNKSNKIASRRMTIEGLYLLYAMTVDIDIFHCPNFRWYANK